MANVTVLDATTNTAVRTAVSQQAHCEALIAPWSGGSVTARIYDGGTLLRTLTLATFTIDTTTSPRSVVCGAVTADTHAATGTPTKVVFRTGSTDIFQIDAGVGTGSIAFAGTVKALCAPDLDAVVFTSSPLLLPMGEFDSVTFVTTDANAPHGTSGQYLLCDLHASGGAGSPQGDQYTATCSDLLDDPDSAYDASFWLFRGTAVSGVNVTRLRLHDDYGTYPSTLRREMYHMGVMPTSGAALKLFHEARLDALMKWAEDNTPNCSTTQRYCVGGSMGAWGSMTFGVRHPNWFAAVYPDRPRVRYNNTSGAISLPEWTTAPVTYNPASGAPDVSARWGAGSMQDHMDLIAYVADTSKKIPWIGWNIGSADGFSVFSDHVALVAALRTARRGFAFAWNAGNHSTGSIPTQITASYPYGLFKLGEGYPLFENHSLDDDPSVDAVGQINCNLTFRNVSESAGAWSCEVTNISAGCTVDVSPISDIYTGDATPQTVTIPSANSWQTVSFP
jgi:hypothetical protein